MIKHALKSHTNNVEVRKATNQELVQPIGDVLAIQEEPKFHALQWVVHCVVHVVGTQYKVKHGGDMLFGTSPFTKLMIGLWLLINP